jgi:hypothetical protein
VPGISLRLVAAASSVVAGVALATVTLLAMDHLQDHVSGQLGFDDR